MSATRIGRSIVVTGAIETPEGVVVEGRVEGSIVARGHVDVDRRGVVRGDIVARTLDVEGEVEGPVTATDRIEIRADGTVIGDIRAARILIADGARFEGTVHMDRSRDDD